MKNPSPKQDFGSYQHECGVSFGATIIIAESFTPLNLTLSPDGISSISANISDMLVTFDFYDEILKVFLYIFQEFGMIDKEKLAEQMQKQTDQPIIVRFSGPVLLTVTGVVLTCELSKSEINETTSEYFIPLLITEAKIVQKPFGSLVPRFFELKDE
jgi:hypothetical protein